MSSHPDADAFVRAILRDPADLTTRLVFADWLEETGEPSNVAWAHFIRLSAGIAAASDRYELAKLNQQLRATAPMIRATLALPAWVFVAHHELLLKLLPATQFIIWLAGFEIPRSVIELIPESVARENSVLPLALDGNTLVIVTADSDTSDTVQKLAFILNKDIIAVRAEGEDIQAEIIRYYGDREYEYVDSLPLDLGDIGFASTSAPINPALHEFLADADAPVVRLVNLIFTEAIHIGSTGVRVLPTAEGVTVQYRIRGTWLNRDAAPARLWRGIATRIAIMANIPIDAVIEQRVTIAGTITLRVGNTTYTLRVTARERIDGLFIEIDRDPITTTPA